MKPFRTTSSMRTASMRMPSDGPKPPLRLNNFGIPLGGPLYIPKVYDGRNRTFWFSTPNGSCSTASTSATSSSCRSRPSRRATSPSYQSLLHGRCQIGYGGRQRRRLWRNLRPGQHDNRQRRPIARAYSPATSSPRPDSATSAKTFSAWPHPRPLVARLSPQPAARSAVARPQRFDLFRQTRSHHQSEESRRVLRDGQRLRAPERFRQRRVRPASR